MRGNAAGNEIRETDGEAKLVSNEQRRRGWGGEGASRLKDVERKSVLVYLSDEDAGNAFRIVSFRVGRSEQLLTFPLLKAVEEGRIQDVLQHLGNRDDTR